MKVIDLVNKATRLLDEKGVNNARLEAQVLLQHVLGHSRAKFLISLREDVDEQIEPTFDKLLKQRGEGMPLQYLLGEQEFMGLPFKVNPDVLIPRPETELLVEYVLKWSKKQQNPQAMADIGTGSGAIAVSLASHLPKVSIYAVDISQVALAVAKENAAANNVADCITFLQGDLLEPLKGMNVRFNCIVSNPPYVTEAEMTKLQREVLQEPSLALVGGADGLDYYRRLAQDAPKLLLPKGLLAVEIGSQQGEAVAQLFTKAGFSEVKVLQDLAGLDRVVSGEWLVASH